MTRDELPELMEYRNAIGMHNGDLVAARACEFCSLAVAAAEAAIVRGQLSGLPLVSVSPSEEAVNAALGSFNIEFWKDSPAIAAFMRENHEKAIRAAYAAQFGSSAPPKEGV